MKLFSLLLLVLLANNCRSSSHVRKKFSSQGVEQDKILKKQTVHSSSFANDPEISSSDELEFKLGKVDILHIIDPKDGTYQNKVTIAKNFNGFLYISGLNITSLASKVISVRFKFGRELGSIIVKGVIGRVSGITPSSNMDIIQLDFKKRPFENLRLLYDLYDYKNYHDLPDEDADEPSTDPYGKDLYCRGLALEHDPTFTFTNNNNLCDGLDPNGSPSSEQCLYAYAKVLDSGLWREGLFPTPLIPTLPQIDHGLENTASQKCLPDTGDQEQLNGVLDLDLKSLAFNTKKILLNGEYFSYLGPYRSLSSSLWEIDSSALSQIIFTPKGILSNGDHCSNDFKCVNNCCLKETNTCGDRKSKIDTACLGGGPAGLFEKTLNGDIQGGIKSFLFPRAGRLNLSSSTEYFGSETPFSSKTLQRQQVKGETKYVDGCNLRVMGYNHHSHEGIGSCNITAILEIIDKDLKVLASSTKIKLQVIRPHDEDHFGREILSSAFPSCKNSSSCKDDECCYNKTCWAKELVSQCQDENVNIGSFGIGEICATDLECSSLCCDSSKGTCRVHVNNPSQTALCGKSPGETCLSKEFCYQEDVRECLIVKTGISMTGEQECSLRCYYKKHFGDCIDGVCVPPPLLPVPPFDPNAPDCKKAVDPPYDDH